MQKYFILIYFFYLFFGISILQSQPKWEKKTENFPYLQNEEFKEIEKNWLQELNKKNRPLNKNLNESEQILENTVETPKNQTLMGEPPSFINIFFRFIMILVVFSATMIMIIRYFKKKNFILNNHSSPIEVLASIPLMSGKFLQIVDIAGQIVILGISEHNISLVQVVENSTIAEKIRLWKEIHKKKEKEAQWYWKDILSKLLGGNFSMWHNKENYTKDFYAELVQNSQNDNVKFDDLMELLEIQKKKLKRYEQL